mmetsp:Transcript_14483/g.14097  ORF Transcript_14483/g.14097 Transcript_14483/m.14097 type:complete len:103 (-) Transcript_14483:1978-2286(-)
MFYSIYADKIDLMRIMGSLSLILLLTMFAFTIFLHRDLNRFKGSYNCAESMAIIDEEEFPTFQCSEKYLATSDEITELLANANCPLEMIREEWEVDRGSDSS